MIGDGGQRHLNLAGSLVALGLISILGFVTWALVYVTLPEANQNALTLLIGVLSANVGMVVGFFFGSSAENKRLSEAVATQAKTAQTAGNALPGATSDTMVIPPDAKATVTPTEDGAVVHRESAP